MSLILDALRGGRPRAVPRPHSSGVRTDAVLQTLGHGRSSPGRPRTRIRRLAGFLAAGVLAAILIWALAIWLTRSYVTIDSTPAATPRAPLAGTPVSPSLRTPAPERASAHVGTLVSAKDHFQLALYYQQVGDFDNSLSHYRAVLQRDELNAEAHQNLGLLFREKGLADEAVKEFRAALAIDSRHAAAHYGLAVVLDTLGDRGAALAHYRAFLRYQVGHQDLAPAVRQRIEALQAGD